MKILVVTMYDGVSDIDVSEWADQVFKGTLAVQFGPEQMAEMKKDFLSEVDVVAQSKSPDGKMIATTRWKLTK